MQAAPCTLSRPHFMEGKRLAAAVRHRCLLSEAVFEAQLEPCSLLILSLVQIFQADMQKPWDVSSVLAKSEFELIICS